FHNFLKAGDEYQETARSETLSFPRGSGWMGFTDMVSHSVLSGRYALEQTFLSARDSLALPQNAPITILGRLSGTTLAQFYPSTSWRLFALRGGPGLLLGTSASASPARGGRYRDSRQSRRCGHSGTRREFRLAPSGHVPSDSADSGRGRCPSICAFISDT